RCTGRCYGGWRRETGIDERWSKSRRLRQRHARRTRRTTRLSAGEDRSTARRSQLNRSRRGRRRSSWR
ncbi:unnamed protein product, partial [Ectocarpus fasciculatus]